MIRSRLSAAHAKIEGSRYRVHVYADGSIDGELTFKPPRGESVDDVATQIEEAFRGEDERHISFHSEIWISVGARYSLKDDEERSGSARYKGMDEVGVHYQSATRTNIAEVFYIFKTKSVPGLHKKYRRKAETVYVRLHWNAERRQPKY